MASISQPLKGATVMCLMPASVSRAMQEKIVKLVSYNLVAMVLLCMMQCGAEPLSLLPQICCGAYVMLPARMEPRARMTETVATTAGVCPAGRGLTVTWRSTSVNPDPA